MFGLKASDKANDGMVVELGSTRPHVRNFQ